MTLRKFLLASFCALPIAAWSQVPDKAEDTCPTVANADWPEAPLLNMDGSYTTSIAALGDKPAVFVFFRGGWCPYCNRHLSDLRLITDDLENLGIQLIAISPDSPKSLRENVVKNDLNYTLLSDNSASLMKALHIGFRVDKPTREKYRGYGIDLEKASGKSHHILPVPSVYIVDKDGKIRYQYSETDYKIRLDNETILKHARDAVSH